MKRTLAIILAAVLIVCMIPASGFASSKGASLSPQKLEVNEKSIECEKYNIYDYNYFKLRDIAKLLSGTDSQFEVGWDEATETISITTGKPYTEVGGELALRGDYSKKAKVSSQTILIDGKLVSNLSVYNIGDNNFFKLRDLGAALGFEVDYQADTDTAEVFSTDYSVSPKRQFNSLLAQIWQTRYSGTDLEKEGAKYIPSDKAVLDDAKAVTKEEKELLKSGNKGKEILTPEEAKEDMELLFKVLKGTYSAYYYFGAENFETAKADILAWIDTQTQVKSTELRDKLRNETEFMKDGHSWLGVPYRTAFGTYQSFIAFQYEFDKDPNGFYTLFNNEKYYVTDLPEGVSIERTLFESGRIAYAPVAHAYENKMADQQITLKTEGGKTKTVKLTWTILYPTAVQPQGGPDFSFLNDNGVTYISLRNFREEAYPDIFAQFEASGTEAKDSRLVIFDLRKNGGGNGYSLSNWTKNFFGKTLAPNEFRYHKVTRIGGSGNAPESIIGKYEKLTAAYSRAEDNNIPFIILVDNETASAGEYAANVLRQINNAIVIGSNTKGNKVAGATTNITLPNSGIACSIGTHMRFVNDFTNYDIVGDEPDVWANPYKVMTSLINMLKYYDLPQSEVINNAIRNK